MYGQRAVAATFQLLDVISLALMWPSGFPTLGPPLVFAILYYWSRRAPSELGAKILAWTFSSRLIMKGREPYARLSFFSFTIQDL